VELLALEQAAANAITALLRPRLVAVQRSATRAWIGAFGSLDSPGDPIRAAAIAAQVRGGLAQIRVSASGPLADYAQRALELGVRQAVAEVNAPGVRLEARVLPGAVSTAARRMTMTADSIGATVDAPTARLVAGLDQTVAAALGDAERAVAQVGGGSFAEVDAALAKAHRAVPKASATVVTAINGAANAGKRAVADELGAELLVLAEPDCCTTCAGLAGRTTPAGQPFDAKFAFTFTDSPHIWPEGPLEQPAWHPHCRCECVPYLGTAPGATGPSLPEALQREARRAILKGWSLPSESGPERIRAARKVLARNVAAPASVKAYARRAVNAGRFPTRDVPHRAPPVRRTTKTTPRKQGRTKEGTQ
jgi:hypothetical protein